MIAAVNPLSSIVASLKKALRSTHIFSIGKAKGTIEAYDLWSENYDTQSGNLMLDMDKALFSQLLAEVDIKGKQIADIGCGTGRHWPKLLKGRPAALTGFDVSAGMLRRLEQKFPKAQTNQITDNLFSDVPTATYDILVSTLAVSHIEHVEEALQAWSRILKLNSDIIITDFHPNALAFGAKRTFSHKNRPIAIENYVHYIPDIEAILLKNGFYIVNALERKIDESVKHYYAAEDALAIYEKFKDTSIIYGIHLKRGDGSKQVKAKVK